MLKPRILTSLASAPGECKTMIEIAAALDIYGHTGVQSVGRRLRELCADGKVARLHMGGGKVAWKLAQVSASTERCVECGGEGSGGHRVFCKTGNSRSAPAVDLPAPKLSPSGYEDM